MLDAPPVAYPVGRSRFAAALAVLLWLAALAALVAWFGLTTGPGWRQALAAALVVAGGVAAAWGWARSPTGELSWSEQAWGWSARQAPAAGRRVGMAFVHLDLQQRMLVRFCAPGRSAQWLWLERRSQPARWDDLRRAFYGPGPAPASAAPAEPSDASHP